MMIRQPTPPQSDDPQAPKAAAVSLDNKSSQPQLKEHGGPDGQTRDTTTAGDLHMDLLCAGENPADLLEVSVIEQIEDAPEEGDGDEQDDHELESTQFPF